MNLPELALTFLDVVSQLLLMELLSTTKTDERNEIIKRFKEDSSEERISLFFVCDILILKITKLNNIFIVANPFLGFNEDDID
jgi:acetylglutamate synthase